MISEGTSFSGPADHYPGARHQDEVKADFWVVFDVADAEPGDAVITAANCRAGEFAAKWKSR